MFDTHAHLFKEYYTEIEYNKEGLEKLREGIYPISMPPKNPIHIRIKNFIRKNLFKS